MHIDDVYVFDCRSFSGLVVNMLLLAVLIGVRFARDTTPRYQISAVNLTEKNRLSHGPHHFCYAAWMSICCCQYDVMNKLRFCVACEIGVELVLVVMIKSQASGC
jgi:hypothetical protein